VIGALLGPTDGTLVGALVMARGERCSSTCSFRNEHADELAYSRLWQYIIALEIYDEYLLSSTGISGF
jgi:hypothetical protein